MFSQLIMTLIVKGERLRRGEQVGKGGGNTILVLFPTVYFIGQYILVLDCDTFRLEVDYRSIMHILVKVLSNQDSATRMALKPVRVQILSLGMVA